MDSNVVFDQKVIIGLAPVLTYAACEWFLIFLMFIDALLSYLLVWFARYCRLQMPCFLCSKLLHPLHWRILLCRNHRLEVSSFMSCQNHDNNLADCRGMCDDCLLSFTKITGPNPDMNRLLLGKLGYDLLSKSHLAHHTRSCSCCNKPWRTRHHTQRLIRLGSRGRNSASKPNIPAPRHLTRRGSRGSLKKMSDHKENSGAECSMARVGYTELKIHSDSESEFRFSDNIAFFPITDFDVEPSERKPVEAEEHEAVFSELITMSEARPFLLGLPRENDAGVAPQNENEADVSDNLFPCGWETQMQANDDFTDFAQNLFVSAVKIDASEAVVKQKASDHIYVSGSVASRHSNDDENGDGVSKPLTSNSMSDFFSNEEEDEVNDQSKPLTSKTGSFAEEQSSEEDRSNDYSVAKSHSSNEEDVNHRDSEPLTSNNVTGSATEEHPGKGEHGETESLASPKPPNEESALEHSYKDYSKVTETNSISNGSPELKHSASAQSFVSISSDIEGESRVDLLKQQLEHERKCLRDLNKELEEERNASAIAINEAMAMITRLQEEKAALHMEALQYLRMMDEQAEHDVDALERTNNDLADREKEMQDLEMELEYYRAKYPDEPQEEILASMGVLGDRETSSTSTPDETSNKAPTDTTPLPGV